VKKRRLLVRQEGGATGATESSSGRRRDAVPAADRGFPEPLKADPCSFTVLCRKMVLEALSRDARYITAQQSRSALPESVLLR
jgi:hypothetical protein